MMISSEFDTVFRCKLFLTTSRGFHFFWNYIQNSVLGIAKPEGQVSIINVNVNGPSILTGDSTGFEPSIITLLIAILIGLYYFREAHKKEKIIKPIWKKKK